jgi:2-phospho-L-lactate guanylyltransferase
VSTVAILPVKPVLRAKQRLAASLSAGDRQALVMAMFSDVLVALGRCRSLDRVHVVTGDRQVEELAAGYGATIGPDRAPDHSAAALSGLEAMAAAGAGAAVLVPGDCPLLDPAELDDLIRRLAELDAAAAGRGAALIVPDRHGSGTNALGLTLPSALEPAFGPGSRERHVATAAGTGGLYEVVAVPSLGLDVDTPEDLAALETELAARHGGAAHTRGMLSQLARSAGRR